MKTIWGILCDMTWLFFFSIGVMFFLGICVAALCAAVNFSVVLFM